MPLFSCSMFPVNAQLAVSVLLAQPEEWLGCFTLLHSLGVFPLEVPFLFLKGRMRLRTTYEA